MTKAHVEYDPMGFGVRLAVSKWQTEGESTVLLWQPVIGKRVRRDEALPADSLTEGSTWLRLDEEDARAIYDALGRYFGGSPDALNVRKDYEAERARVDVFIKHLTSPQ